MTCRQAILVAGIIPYALAYWLVYPFWKVKK